MEIVKSFNEIPNLYEANRIYSIGNKIGVMLSEDTIFPNSSYNKIEYLQKRVLCKNISNCLTIKQEGIFVAKGTVLVLDHIEVSRLGVVCVKSSNIKGYYIINTLLFFV